MKVFIPALVLCLLQALCGLVFGTASRSIGSVFLEVGSNVGQHVGDRVEYLLKQSTNTTRFISGTDSGKPASEGQFESCIVVLLGNAADFDGRPEFLSLPAESFALRLTTNHKYNSSLCRYALMANGYPLSRERHNNVSFDVNKIHYGAVLGSYALLEFLGFAFLHPLEPYVPERHYLIGNLAKDIVECEGLSLSVCDYYHAESPYWPERSFHLHTQHPLELVDVLQGHDIPREGPIGSHCVNSRRRHYERQLENRQLRTRTDCSPFCSENAVRCNDSYVNSDYTEINGGDNSSTDDETPYCERWEDMLDDVNRLFEWAIANRLNKLEWLLLGSYRWVNDMDTRLERFRMITDLGHQYSLLIGVDVPIGNIQQHAWYMVDTKRPLREQFQQIRDRVDWIFSANFDFLTTESGLSEFTHPECEVMLEILNEFANYVNGSWGREASIKVHCSTGQVCKNFLDPLTGKPVNFNFLTLFATPKLGIFPHTIQLYSLDDPTAHAYGNENFSYIEDYLVEEAKLQNRSVVFYGETAYWVNVDSDVPLFLPLYGQRRLYDLRKIAWRGIKENFKIDGQMNFDSGWEWGYWLSDVVTARASWDPMLPSNCSSDGYNPKQDEWSVFKRAMKPFTKIFPEAFVRDGDGILYSIGEKIADILVELSFAQSELLIHGRAPGSEKINDSGHLRQKSGIPYLSGDDTWIDLPRMFGLHLFQPDKIHLQEVTSDNWFELKELLETMDVVFGNLSTKIQGLYNSYYCSITDLSSPSARLLFEEIVDSVRLLALRAKQVHILYESQYQKSINSSKATLETSYKRSRDVIHEAQTIVRRREQHYRVPPKRIASYRENPTVYRYGYVWSVHSLYYWWRDQGIAEGRTDQSTKSPCYLNRIDATEVAVGVGKEFFSWLRGILEKYSPFSLGSQPYPLEFLNCLAPPDEEYVFPRDL